jgi:hypothetical protein
MSPITLVGLSIVLFYAIIQILKFYGVSEDVYGVYLLFYLFLIACVLVLPNGYPTV